MREGGSVSPHWGAVSCGGHILSPEGQPEEGRPEGCRLHGPEFITHGIFSLLTGHRHKAKGWRFTGLISHGKIILLCQIFVFTDCGMEKWAQTMVISKKMYGFHLLGFQDKNFYLFNKKKRGGKPPLYPFYSLNVQIWLSDDWRSGSIL